MEHFEPYQKSKMERFEPDQTSKMERFEPYQTSKMERFEKIVDDFTEIFLRCDKLTSCAHNAILKTIKSTIKQILTRPKTY